MLMRIGTYTMSRSCSWRIARLTGGHGIVSWSNRCRHNIIGPCVPFASGIHIEIDVLNPFVVHNFTYRLQSIVFRTKTILKLIRLGKWRMNISNCVLDAKQTYVQQIFFGSELIVQFTIHFLRFVCNFRRIFSLLLFIFQFLLIYEVLLLIQLFL